MSEFGTQKERIIKYLQDFGSITPLQALADLGIMRLGGADMGPEERRMEHSEGDTVLRKPLRRAYPVCKLPVGIIKNFLGGQTHENYQGKG